MRPIVSPSLTTAFHRPVEESCEKETEISGQFHSNGSCLRVSIIYQTLHSFSNSFISKNRIFLTATSSWIGD